MVGKCHSADLVGTSPDALFVPSATRRIKALFRVPFTEIARRQEARLHQRPSVQPTVTATPKQADTRAEVTTSGSGPDATSRPPETRPPWVNPGGISSQWCVTRTIGGLTGSGAQ